MSKRVEYNKKVMEDLDALLADLQSTTAHIGQSPGGRLGSTPSPRTSYQASPRTSYQASPQASQTPPPLPPPPQEILDTIPPPHQFGDQPLYEPQNIKRDQRISGSSQGSGDQQFYRDPLPPPSQAPPPIGRTGPGSSPAPPPPQPGMSMISNNLSELDQLLSDLNSAQFMAEVDKKHAQSDEEIVDDGDESGKVPPPVAPKPNRNVGGNVGINTSTQSQGGSTVDSLLDQLESSVPASTGPHGGYPVSPGPHGGYPVSPGPQGGYPVASGQVNTASFSYQPDVQQPNAGYNHSPSVQQPNAGYNHSPVARSPEPAVGYQQHMEPAQQVGYQYSQQQTAGSYQTTEEPAQSSAATQELDDLMASLSGFKMKDKSAPPQVHIPPPPRSPSPGSEPSYAKPHKSRNLSQSSSANSTLQSNSMTTGSTQGGQLESMLGDLQSDMSRQGVNTKTKGLCAACNQPVVGQVITALGKIWHIEHFSCAHCHETLGTKNFYERDNMAFCEKDYHALFAPKCAYCNGPIVDKCVTALTKTWHPEHFFCAQCGRPFGDDGFHEKDGKAYCRADFFEMFAPKCGGCGRAIVDNYISALNRHWHPECFACWDCHQPFGGGSFFDYEGLPYCETHYHSKKGSLCAGCQKPITGRCITAMYKKFHPEHFVCAFCLKQLNKGTFKEQNDRPYCHPCFVKLFG